MKIRSVSLLLVAIFFTGVANAQQVVRKGVKPVTTNQVTSAPNFTMERLQGKWQEWNRISISENKQVSFTDSLMLNFNKRDFVEIRDGVSMAVAGEAFIEKPNGLLMAGDAYTISSLSKNNLLVNDGVYLRHLKRMKNFHYESFGKAKPDMEDYNKAVAVNPSLLPGKWEVYKRQAAPGFINEQGNKLIKSIQISEVSEGNAAASIVVYDTAASETITGHAQFKESQFTLSAIRNNWNFTVYKLTADEWIMGQTGGIMYFMKKL